MEYLGRFDSSSPPSASLIYKHLINNYNLLQAILRPNIGPAQFIVIFIAFLFEPTVLVTECKSGYVDQGCSAPHFSAEKAMTES